MKSKRITAFLMTAALMLSMTACNGGSGSSSESGSDSGAASAEQETAAATEEPAASDGDSYTIGICQMLEHPALDAATEGFQDACKEKFGEDKVEFDLQNAQGEQADRKSVV